MALLTATGLTAAGVLAVPANAVVGGAGATAQRANTRTSAGDDGLERFRDQHLAWHTCATGKADDKTGAALEKVGAECAEVTVPLDYTAPRGRTIQVVISRVKAADRASRRGALLLNPGGPGGPGLALPYAVVEAAPKLAPAYDLIGMDPRFVGRSNPIPCVAAVAQRSPAMTGTSPNHDPWSPRTFAEDVVTARQEANRCAQDGKGLLEYATTRNTARDMDVIRAVLGEQKLNYLGWSYGTYLGAVYTQLFGDHAGRVVLDSAVGPDVYGPTLTRPMGAPMQTALAHWAAWTAARNGTYHLGTTSAQVLDVITRLEKRAGRTPIRVGTLTFDGRMLPVVPFMALYVDGDTSYGGLATDIRTLRDAADGKKVTPTERLTAVFDPEANTDYAGIPVLCADKAAPRDPQSYYRDMLAHRADEPLFAPLTRTLNACAFWTAAPREAATQFDNDVPMLIVGAAHDPVTPYREQQAMHRALHGSRMLTLNGYYGHAVFIQAENDCVNSAVTSYLLGGDLPGADTTCTT